MKKKPDLKPRSMGASSMAAANWAYSADYQAIGQAILLAYEHLKDAEFTVDCHFVRNNDIHVCTIHDCPASWCFARAYVAKQAADKRWQITSDRYHADDGEGKK